MGKSTSFFNNLSIRSVANDCNVLHDVAELLKNFQEIPSSMKVNAILEKYVNADGLRHVKIRYY